MESKELPTDEATDATVDEKKVVDEAQGVNDECGMLITNKETADMEPNTIDETSEDKVEGYGLDDVVGNDVGQIAGPNVTVDPEPQTEITNEGPKDHTDLLGTPEPQNAATEAQTGPEASLIQEPKAGSSEKADLSEPISKDASETKLEGPPLTSVTVEEKKVLDGTKGTSKESSMLITGKETADTEPDTKVESSEDIETAATESENKNDSVNVVGHGVEQIADPNVMVDLEPNMEIAEEGPKNHTDLSVTPEPQNAATEAQEHSEASPIQEPEAESSETADVSVPMSKEASESNLEEPPLASVVIEAASENKCSDDVDMADTATKTRAGEVLASVKEASTEVSGSADASVVMTQGVEEPENPKCKTEETKQESSENEQNPSLTETKTEATGAVEVASIRDESSKGIEKVDVNTTENLGHDKVSETSKIPDAAGEVPQLPSEYEQIADPNVMVDHEPEAGEVLASVKEENIAVSESAGASVIITNGVEKPENPMCKAEETKQESSKNEQHPILTSDRDESSEQIKEVDVNASQNLGLDKVAETSKVPNVVGEVHLLPSEDVPVQEDEQLECQGKISRDLDTSALVAEVGEVSSKEKKTLQGFLSAEANTENLENGNLISANDSDVAPVTEVGSEEEKASAVAAIVNDVKAKEEKYSDCAELLGVEKDEHIEETVERDLIEASKDQDVANKYEEVPKLDIPVKSSLRRSSSIISTMKHSSSIISKMKHSFGRVKKAIIGKSPSSKTMSAADKDEIKLIGKSPSSKTLSTGNKDEIEVI